MRSSEAIERELMSAADHWAAEGIPTMKDLSDYSAPEINLSGFKKKRWTLKQKSAFMAAADIAATEAEDWEAGARLIITALIEGAKAAGAYK